MKIEIGKTIEGDQPVRLDLSRLVDSRMLVTASSGGGKSWALRLLAEQTCGHIQTVILDPEGEFSSLREKFDFLLIAKSGDIQPEPRAAGLLAKKLAELQVSAVIDLFDLHFDQRRNFVKVFLESLINVPRNLWHPMLVMLDEAHKFCPEGKDTDSSNAVIDLMSQGRKRGMCGILATQRLSKLNKDAAAEANNNLIGRTPLGNDQKRAADILGMEKSDWMRLRDLPDGGWFGFGPAFSEKGVVNFITADVQTTHPKAGQRHKLQAPKASEAVKQIAAQLADLPQQAEAEIRTIEDARREITALKRELKAKPVVEKPVETVKRVEIPVVGIRQIQRLESAVKAMAALHESLNGHCKKIEDSYAGVGQRAKEIEAALAKARREGEKPHVVTPPGHAIERHMMRARITPTSQPQLIGEGPASPEVGKGGIRRILIALAQRPQGLTEGQISVRAKLSIKGGSFSTYLSKIRGAGWIKDGDNGRLQITQDGINAIGSYEPLPEGPALLAYWINKLGNSGISRMLQVIAEAWPESITEEQLSEKAAVAITGGSFSTYLSKLRTLELISGKGNLKASDELFQDVKAVR